jgi:hypothetical protein
MEMFPDWKYWPRASSRYMQGMPMRKRQMKNGMRKAPPPFM